jgi:DNA-binding MarR family transcriptional regulator
MKNSEMQRLDNQICFRVYSLERAILAAYRPYLKELGITYPQYLVLMALWEHHSLTIGGLCDLLGLDTGTVSPLVKRMEKQKLLTRSRLPEDERTVVVELTDAGSRLKARAAHIPHAIGSCILGREGDQVDIVAFQKLRQALDEALKALQNSVCDSI